MKKPGLVNLLLCVIFISSASYSYSQGEPFSKRIVASGFNSAWEVVYGPNDSLWVTENSAYTISRVSIADGFKTPLINLRSSDASINFTSGSGTQPQGGLMGLALHPNLYSTDAAVRATKRWVYAAYVYERGSCPGTNTSCIFTTKIVRFDYNGTSLSNPTIVLDNIPGSSDHNSGRLVFGPTIEPGSTTQKTQYRLYYTVGDMGAGQFLNTTRTENAQTVNSLEGKVLRINSEVDGDAGANAWVPDDNPFYTAGTVSARDYVYSIGHRNPQGLAWGYTTSGYQLFSSEQMDKTDDEVNIIERGRNYGWDKVSGYCEGNVNGYRIGQTSSANEQAFCTPSVNHRNPIFTTFTASAAQMATVNSQPNSQWPTIASSSIAFYGQTKIAGWNKSLLISSLKQDKVYRIKPSADGTDVDPLSHGFDTASYFRGDGNRIRRVIVAPNGLKFYVARDASAAVNGGTIMEYTFTGTTLPVQFTGIQGNLLPNGQVKIDWEAITDEEHDHFEVERSSNGTDFVNLGVGPAAPPYFKIDASPLSGNNFYRIKQLDIDGRITYSNVINIVSNPSRLTVSAFPNPVSGMLNVTISASVADKYSITLSDLGGRKIFERRLLMPVNSTSVSIDLHDKPSHLYILIVRNGRNEIVSSERITRL